MRSIGFMPAARSLIRTCPGPGSGVGISATAGVAPYSVTVIHARIDGLLPVGAWSVSAGSHRRRLGSRRFGCEPARTCSPLDRMGCYGTIIRSGTACTQSSEGQV